MYLSHGGRVSKYDMGTEKWSLVANVDDRMRFEDGEAKDIVSIFMHKISKKSDHEGASSEEEEEDKKEEEEPDVVNESLVIVRCDGQLYSFKENEGETEY